MTLRSNYHLVLGHKTNGPTYHEVDPLLYRSGSDGLGTLTGYAVYGGQSEYSWFI